MAWQSDRPIIETAVYLPRAKSRRRWTTVARSVALLVLLACLVRLAGAAATLLLHFATILLAIALIAGVIAVAALRIGIAPQPKSRHLG